MSVARGNPDKRDVADALLERGSLFIYLDPRRDDVLVPEYLAKQPQLVLQVGMNLAVPIPDLGVDEEGITGTLSFNRSPFFCRVPWDAIFGLVGDDALGVVWDEDLPDEIAAEVEAAQAKATGKPGRARPALRAIDGGVPDDDGASDDDDGGDDDGPPPKRGHLRLVE